MDQKQPWFINLFLNFKGRLLIIVFITIFVTLITVIHSFVLRLNPYLIIELVITVSFFGMYFSIPQLIATQKSEKFRKRLYLKSGKKILSLLSSISFYFILCILIVFLFGMVLATIFTSSDNGEIWAYSLFGSGLYVFIFWLASFLVGVISLLLNSNKSEIVIVQERTPVKVYFSSIIFIFLSVLVLFFVFIFTVENYL
ncbi:MAG: hypothetical protein UR25_C0005G0043 [Candidatus Nomurabacteria bacterium GW2011_GWE1_32_28]|uniref:Uncharacterized protein n=1 Tax=Candidatus Nomurabacteria bacterium GW2011_GWF1_31_48 TaxID=1618767 RepID=A0A0G0ATR0_9BACT|nr:MAG: hypothetical protein UR10_C0003G0241 [Candidatus Nomurabacteria bacterium GW2011_GWF2_30_133]KKP28460.1 MAG: hypothetical protein UR18_C0004G0042 [Candidatus Nomurabacteria bacterium GW2011_GWE2_31_40]KKP30040.1 MAG: hypothetical protein UR19_C0005G0042 [Candidatus Nomurabacteria bacterium GW2011_GWF1_31_48]KKP34559.1 MAG: hypothetical protein UR25_C0005G0043 [Candidatus Nomurabacteria bacterium GW2011_GWE1_32_28]HAS81043.1 hypothetical protein [Candidatus Nomurabacteria bacterium]